VEDHQKRLRAALNGLQQGTSCVERKATIPTIVALRDAAAIPALKRARSRGAANACLRVAADDAIKRLAVASTKKR
jgi:hypothetical protein